MAQSEYTRSQAERLSGRADPPINWFNKQLAFQPDHTDEDPFLDLRWFHCWYVLPPDLHRQERIVSSVSK